MSRPNRLRPAGCTSPCSRRHGLDEDRLKAQRIVYEGSVVYPLVQAARARMQTERMTDAVDAGESQDSRLDREAHALAALAADRIRQGESAARTVDDLPDTVLIPLLQYVTASKAPADEEKLKQLRTGFDSTYSNNPSRQLGSRCAFRSVPRALAQNAPIEAGLDPPARARRRKHPLAIGQRCRRFRADAR